MVRTAVSWEKCLFLCSGSCDVFQGMRPMVDQTHQGLWALLLPRSHGRGGLSGVWSLAPCPARGGEKLVWAESTIGNWIVITRLASARHWGR